MDQIDKKILNTIQSELPLKSRPFLEVGNKININENEVIERVKNLREKGFIRRLGGVFDSKKLGFESTLVALRVEADKIEEVAKKINGYKGVTHNYERDDYFNLWFTLVGSDKEEIKKTLEEIENFEGVEKLLNLPAVKVFKIGLNLSLK